MKEKTLLKLAITSSLSGILLLVIISNTIKVEDKPFNEYEENDFIEFQGKIEKVIKRNNITIATISKLEFVDIIVFDNIKLTEGSDVKIQGKIEIYKGKKEVLVDKITTQ